MADHKMEENDDDDDDDDMRMIHNLDAELSQVEQSLLAPRSNRGGGRAAYRSITDSLLSIRDRLQRAVESSSSSSLAAASSSSTTRQRRQEAASRLSRRLDTAQKAHSTRRPLDMVRQAEEAEQQQGGSTRQQRQQRPQAASLPARLKVNGEEEAAGGGGGGGGGEQQGRQRRPSLLVASRTRASLAEGFQSELYESPVKAIGGSKRHLDVIEERSSGSFVMKDAETEEEEAGPLTIPTPILLTKSQSQRVLRSSSNASLSGSISITSFPDLQQPEQQITTAAAAGSVVYSWGTATPQSGLCSLHDDDEVRTVDASKVTKDSRLGRPGAAAVLSVATGVSHTACATVEGRVLTCGDNVRGCVDPTSKTVTRVPRPTIVESVTARILQVSCGYDHTAALTEHGTVITWGSNAHGQLGHRKPLTAATAVSSDIPTTYCRPQGLVLTGGRRAAAVACGHYFTLVLTTRMCVLACGAEAITGHEGSPLASSPPALQGLPLVAVAAGHHHAVVLTSSGTAYAWGQNDSGCCGRPYPHQLAIPVEMHVPTTTMQGTGPCPINRSGSGSGRNVGLRTSSIIPNWDMFDGMVGGSDPNAVSLADDVSIKHAACGESHTVLVTRSGRLLVCGNNTHGQLGLMGEEPVSPVEPVNHPESSRGCSFIAAEAGASHTLLLDSEGSAWQMGGGKVSGPEIVLAKKQIMTIAAGGDQSIAIAAGTGSLRRQFSVTFSDENNSSLMDGNAIADNLEELLESIHLEEDGEAAGEEIAKRTEELLQNPSVLNSLFFDPSELDRMYPKLVSAGSTKVQQSIAAAIERGIEKGLATIAPEKARMMYPEAVRCLLLYLRFFDRPAGSEISFDVRGHVITALCEAILGLPFEGYKHLLKWATALYSRDLYVNMIVKPLLSQLDRSLVIEVDSDGVQHVGLSRGAVPSIVSVLSWMFNASERLEIANPEDFYSESLSRIPIQALFDDLYHLKNASKSQRASTFFLSASPFLFSPRVKRDLLMTENQIEMFRVATNDGVLFDPLNMEYSVNPFWKLEIEREDLLEQTLSAIKRTSPSDLRKKLRVVFKGEEGVDAGGVAKEFFQLLSEELFDISSGLWTDRFGDEITWFNSDCIWDDEGFELTGVLVGLALYNSVLLDVRFPMAVYRKLLGCTLGLEDMVDLELKNGLQSLLDYEGDDVEYVFCLNFEVTWTNPLGEEKRFELQPGGSKIPVTSENKEEYVLLYVKWLLVDSIYPQWDSFERGVMRVMEGSSLNLFRPEELELLVVGTPELDFDALESNTKYEGYEENTEVVGYFWRYINNADRESQLNFLKFATGTSMAPIGGLAALGFKIQRAGPDSDQLPTSHTCFNTLLLPEYGSYDKLAERLSRAIVECEGFGLQ